jgi:DNA repair protein RadD
MEFRSYQSEAIDGIFDYFVDNTGNPLVVMPTGTGKSIVIGGFTRRAWESWQDTRILILTHVKELIAQNFGALIRFWPEAPAGIYSAGLNKRDIGAQILFAGIQSIHKKAYHLQRVDLVLIDEAHLIGRSDGSMYKKFLEQLREINPHIKIIGFTATPYRMDSGKLHVGKDRIFTDIAVNVPILDMFEKGYLSPVTTNPTDTVLDATGVGTRGGDYIASALEKAMMAGDNTEHAVAEIITLGASRGSWLMFCAGVNHALQVRDAIRAHGIECETVTGDTPPGERDRLLRSFKAGKLRALTNANVLTTGFDAPGVDLIALMRPTKSKGLYVQMVGRGTRLAPGKDDCLVLDFAGNVGRHGPIDMIEGDDAKEKGDGEAPTKDCPECGETNYSGVRICVACGFEFPPSEKEIDVKATDAAIISTQAVPVWVDVDSVSYRAHEKPGKPTSLEVAYQCGVKRYREWVCVQHTGFPREKAAGWWRAHTADPLPATVADALALSENLRKPSSIRIRPVGKYTEIQSRRFT